MKAYTAADIRAARERAARASKGPWRKGNVEPWHVFTPDGAELGPDRVLLRMNMANTRDWLWKEDADFIAAARTDVPILCDMAERYLELRERIEKLAKYIDDQAAYVEARRVDWTDDRVSNGKRKIAARVRALLADAPEVQDA